MKRWLWRLVQASVCVGALWYALTGVSWHDYATLDDGRKLRLVAESDDGRTVTLAGDDGMTFELPRERLARREDGPARIEYGVGSMLARSHHLGLLVAFLMFLPVTPIQALRFAIMLRVQDVRLSYWEAIKLTYAGNFLNFVVLGTTGGDIYKAYYVALRTHRKTEAITAIFLDRVVGLVGLVLVAALAMLLKLDDPIVRQVSVWVGVLLAALVVGGLAFYSDRVRRLVRPDQWLGRLPFADQLRRVDRATQRLREHIGPTVGALALTLLLQAMAIVSFYMAGRALGLRVDPITGYAFIAVGLLVAAIPISPGGLGTLEATLKKLFGAVGATATHSLFLALSVRVIQLCGALPGALVPLMGWHRPSAAALAELESR